MLLLSAFAGAGISYMIYPEIRSLLYSSPVDLVYSPLNKLFFFCIPALSGVVCLLDSNALFEKMKVWARVTCIGGICTYIYIFFFVGEKLQYMIYSYFMLLPICVCFEHAETKESLLDLTVAGVGSVCIVMCGARGAIVSLILYFISRVLLIHGKSVKLKSVIIFFFVLLLCVMLIFYYNEILLTVVNLFDKIGVDSRFIMSIYDGELMEDAARTSIANAIMDGIAENPFGYGLYGDRYAAGKFGHGRYRYAHNIFVELLCDFGIIGGSAAIIFIVWKLAKTIAILRKRDEIHLLMVLLPYGLYQLFFSSSFLENVPFFMIMAMVFCINWKKRIGVQTGEMV